MVALPLPPYVLPPSLCFNVEARLADTDRCTPALKFPADDASTDLRIVRSSWAQASTNLKGRRNLARRTASASVSATWAGVHKIVRKHKNLDEGMSAKVATHRREGVHRITVANSSPILFLI